MNRETQIAILDANNARCKEIMISKSNDYANEDVLSNFKLVAKLEGSTPVKDIFGHIANKVVRLGNLLGNDKIPNHESIDDTLIDMVCYCQLMLMAREEALLTPGQFFYTSELYTSSQNENFDNFLKGPTDPYQIHLPKYPGINPGINSWLNIDTATKTEAPTVNHISQVEKTKLAHEKKSGILSGFDQNGCGRV